jgi:minor histocompatibility antigen H13
MATKSYFLRPHFVFFSLGAIVFVHGIAYAMSSPAFVQLIVNSLACVYVGCMANSKIRVNKGI